MEEARDRARLLRALIGPIVAIALFATAGAPSQAEAARPSAVLIRLPFPEDEGGLTPYSFGRGYSLLTLIYDTVMWRDSNGVPRPWLASAVETSPDQLTVTVHINPGARWQDGPPVTAADIAFSFRYYVTHPQPRFTPELDAASSVDAPDASTAVIHLVRPAEGFIEDALCDLPIIPEHVWAHLPEGALPSGLAVGSGPYRLVAHDAGKLYRFKAVPDYFRGPPAVATIEVPVMTDEKATVMAMERGTVDALPTSLSTDEVATLRSALGLRLQSGDSYTGTVLMVNTRRAPFDRAEVRRALAEAIDLGALTTALGGGGVPADRGYLHPASGWAPNAAVHQVNVDAARTVLSGLGGAPIEVLVPDNDRAQAAAGKEVGLALDRVGLPTTQRSLPVQKLESALGTDGSTPSFQLAIWTSPGLASYDPGLLARLFGSGAALNFSGYASSAFDAATERAAAATDEDTRHAAVADELRQLAADAPVVPLYFPRNTFAFRPNVYDGWVYVKGSGILDKLSFVEPAGSPDSAAVPAPRPGGAGPPSPLLWAALGLLALAALLGLARLVRSWRW